MKTIGIYTNHPQTFKNIETSLISLGQTKQSIHYLNNLYHSENYDLFFVDYAIFLLEILPTYTYNIYSNIVIIINKKVISLSDIDYINCIPFVRMNNLNFDLYSLAHLFHLTFDIDETNILDKITHIEKHITHILSDGNLLHIHINEPDAFFNKHIRIHGKSTANQKIITIRKTIKDTCSLLGLDFMMCNRGTIINTKHIESFSHDYQTVTLQNGTTLKIARMRRKKFKELLPDIQIRKL